MLHLSIDTERPFFVVSNETRTQCAVPRLMGTLAPLMLTFDYGTDQRSYGCCALCDHVRSLRDHRSDIQINLR